MNSKVPSTKVLRPPGGGSSIVFGDPAPQRTPPASRSPYAVEGDGAIKANKSADEYTPKKPYGTLVDVEEAKMNPSPQVAVKSPYGVEDDEDSKATEVPVATKSPFATEDEEPKKAPKEYTPQKPFASASDVNQRPSTKVRKPPGGESHIIF